MMGPDTEATETKESVMGNEIELLLAERAIAARAVHVLASCRPFRSRAHAIVLLV